MPPRRLQRRPHNTDRSAIGYRTGSSAWRCDVMPRCVGRMRGQAWTHDLSIMAAGDSRARTVCGRRDIASAARLCGTGCDGLEVWQSSCSVSPVAVTLGAPKRMPEGSGNCCKAHYDSRRPGGVRAGDDAAGDQRIRHRVRASAEHTVRSPAERIVEVLQALDQLQTASSPPSVRHRGALPGNCPRCPQRFMACSAFVGTPHTR